MPRNTDVALLQSFFIIVNYTDVNRCQGLLMWHPQRAGFIVNHTDVNRCQGLLMWHPHRAWFYSESYRCEQVPRNTDVAPS